MKTKLLRNFSVLYIISHTILLLEVCSFLINENIVTFGIYIIQSKIYKVLNYIDTKFP